MWKKCKQVWVSKSHSFKKAFSKLSVQFIMSQKYSDITANVARFTKRLWLVNFVLTRFSYAAAKLLLLIFLDVLIF